MDTSAVTLQVEPVSVDRRAWPSLDAGRCVHAAIETASCRACVDVCPRGAWRLDDETLELDPRQCDGCGLCLPACPPRAIDLPLPLARRRVVGIEGMVAACERLTAGRPETSKRQQDGHLGCLHAIGLLDLLRAYKAGVRVWLLAHADCAQCPRATAESLFSRVAHLNTALRQRGQAPIQTREISATVAASLLADEQTQSTRRGFFRVLGRRPAAALLGGAAVSESSAPPTLAACLPDGDDALLPWVLGIDTQRCIGCHACARVCPEAAIAFDEALPAYQLRHRNCSGCGLCSDVCEHRAVTVQAWAEPKQSLLPLRKQRCQGCGVDFYSTNTEAARPSCWICSRARPGQRLYQVMA